MKRALVGSIAVLIAVAGCSGKAEHDGNPAGMGSGAGGSGSGGAAGTGSSGAGAGGFAQCSSALDCPTTNACEVCEDGTTSCDVGLCLEGVCVVQHTSCGLLPGTGGAGGMAGAGGIAGAAGFAGAGAAGSAGDAGASGGTCADLLAQVDANLASARACAPMNLKQCATIVKTPCGCDVALANDENSYTTFYYLNALGQLQMSGCPIPCPKIACFPVTGASCMVDSSGSGVCTPN